MGKSSAAAKACTSRSRSETTWKMRGEHEPHRKITRGAGAGGSDLIQFPRSQIVVESVPPLDVGRDGAPLAEFSREQGGLEWKWERGGRRRPRPAAGYCTPACPSTLLTRKRDFLPSREALKLENPYIGRGPSSPTRAGWMNPFSEIISHPNFLHISEAKKPVVNPRYHRGIWNSGSWRQSRPR